MPRTNFKAVVIDKSSASNRNPKEYDQIDGRMRHQTCVNGSSALKLSSDTAHAHARRPAVMKFALPTSSGIFLLSNDSSTFGAVVLDTTKQSSSNDIEVDVVVSGSNQHALQHSVVCYSVGDAEHSIRMMRMPVRFCILSSAQVEVRA